MDKLRVKICGMTDLQNVEEISKLSPDYLGYIFYSKSARYVGDNPDPRIFSSVPDEITKVGVFVNENYENMLKRMDAFNIQGIQLHGSESPEICKALKNLGKTVIKVFPGNQQLKIEILEAYIKYVDFFLFDTPVLSYGGSGRKFDWSILQRIKLNKKFFLSGGISLEDLYQLKKINNPSLYAVDINSRFELSPGIKNPVIVKEFLNKIRKDEEE